MNFIRDISIATLIVALAISVIFLLPILVTLSGIILITAIVYVVVKDYRETKE